jgi:hypothetical protein
MLKVTFNYGNWRSPTSHLASPRPNPTMKWSGSELPCSDADRALFRACTKIELGDGEKTSFWHDKWCDRGPLQAWAPELYKIATREKRTVAKEIKGNNWIRSIARLNTPIQLSQYLEIWDVIATLQLTPDQPDTISWTLTADGKYSASSAYHAQFVGSHPRFVAQKIWNASAKPKCKLFAWLALHGNLLTADMLVVRGWPHDSACRLCLSALETATHLCKDCPFTMVIWSQVQTWDNADLGAPPSSFATTSKWWDTLIGGKTSIE